MDTGERSKRKSEGKKMDVPTDLPFDEVIKRIMKVPPKHRPSKPKEKKTEEGK